MKDLAGELKERVRLHWENEICGTRYGLSEEREVFFDEIMRSRYALEPFIPEFADFANACGKRILEIGVGSGSDFFHWVNNQAFAVGIDLSKAAVELTRERIRAKKLTNKYYLLNADAENLPFRDDCYDGIYSWGVLHHTPDTRRAIREVYRVVKPGGLVRLMIYHTPSWTGFMLWFRYGLMKGRWWKSLKQITFEHLESPGTKVYGYREARDMLFEIGFKIKKMYLKLGPSDLLKVYPSSKYRSPFYKFIWKIYPRWLIRLFGDRLGLYLLIEAMKPL